MHGLFGFDPKTFSDDELLDRLTELNRRIIYASRFMSGSAVAALQEQRMACEFEQRERALAGLMQARIKAPTVLVETDPDLAAQAKAERDAEEARNTPKNHPRPKPFGALARERLKPTARPIVDK